MKIVLLIWAIISANIKMKTKVKKTLILLLFAILLCNGCKDEPTPPEPLPEGYQQDIPWPSLDSPWPIYQGDPQLTGRSKYAGPQLGNVEWKIEIPHESNSGEDYLSPVIGSDSLIYVLTINNAPNSSPTLKSFDFMGKLIRDINLGGFDEASAPPLISADGTIYIPKWADDSLYALTKTGSIKWKKKLDSSILGVMNLGRDGTLYGFSLDGILYAISPDGSTKWTLPLPDGHGSPASRISISPDGKTLYVSGNNLYAVSDLGELKWIYSSSKNRISPLIDNAGNIYFGLNDKAGIICIKPDKSERFCYQTPYQIHADITMDKKGNIYFSSGDSLYSIDYIGKLRWQKYLKDAGFVSSFVCDANSNIYFILYSQKELYSFTESGKIRFSIPLDGSTSISPALSKNGNLYFLTSETKRYLYSIN